jgi:hypothetical protein
VALIRAPTPYDWTAEPTMELPHEAEDGAENSQGDSVVEGRAESDGRGLDGGKVWSSGLAIVRCMTQLAQRCALAMMQVGSRSTYTTGRPL